VGIEKAQTLAMIDLDACPYVEYDDNTKEPLALIEIAKDIGQSFKIATVTRNLALKAGIEAYSLLYTPSKHSNPADNQWPDIECFRVKQIYPVTTDWKIFTPEVWAKCLVNIRKRGAAKIDEEIENREVAWNVE
jgi:hypothetical protein